LLRAIEELWTRHRTVHRDIKPQNVIKLSSDKRPFVLLDLGIAYGLLETGLTRDGSVRCTPRYLAPEMARPDFRSNLDFRSDLYTAALTVFEYSAQIHPLAKTQDDLIQTISRALHQPPRRLKNERPDFSDEFCDLIDQMLKKKPQLRPSDLTALIAAMEGSR
jgi:serine/threonine protein kinase